MNLNILIADPDRDFLMSFKSLLELSGNAVKTVFDGTQVITGIAESRYDIVILNENIPRIRCKDIVKYSNDENIPVIIISEKKINVSMLCSEYTANSYLSLPFLPYELTERIDDICQKRKSDETLSYANVEFDVSKFTLCQKVKVTNEELNIFKHLISNQTIDNQRAGPYINALNNKFEKLNQKLRIKYLINKGYRLVIDDE